MIRAASNGSERLDDVTAGIFTGLQTNDDGVYVLEERGVRGGLQVVWSNASRRLLELEPDLLHQFASGQDVERHAFRPLSDLVLFPYVSEGNDVRLISEAELDSLPRTKDYLAEHETRLRARERGRMDRAEWYAYVYPKSLRLQDLPKLGVAATVRRLEVAADPDGAVYFHNVRVNGIRARWAGVPNTLFV